MRFLGCPAMLRPYGCGEGLRRGDTLGRPRSTAACGKRAGQCLAPTEESIRSVYFSPPLLSPGVSPSAPECPRPIHRNLLKASLSLMTVGDEKEETPEPAILFVLKFCSWAEPVPESAAGPGSVLLVRAGELARPRRFGSRLGPPSAAGLFARALSSRASLDRSLFVLRLCWGPELSALMLLLRMSDNVLDALLMVGNCARAPELQQTRANPAVESAVKARIVLLPLLGMSAA
jgi:hypothetical protein